jgi:two-component system, NarL family, sensor histidine kinase UhpB
MHERLIAMRLFWRVFWTNAAVLVVAVLALLYGPLTVSSPIGPAEVTIVLAGLVAALAVNFELMRLAFRPFDELADRMRRHDPLSHGERVEIVGGPNVTALAQAFNEMLDRLEDERRMSARRALTVQEGERRRVARELHDEVGQTLTGVMLQVEGLAARIPDDLRDPLEELRETARSGAEEVRRIVRRLRPEALEDLGLPSALAALTTAFGEQTGVLVERRVERAVSLSDEEDLVFYRVAQEALTNIARHAGATRVRLELRSAPEGVIMIVRDDGRGLLRDPGGSTHGIRGMRERALLIGAHLTVTGPPGRGTEVRLVLPPDRGAA